jgi:hypothetical protein
MKFVVGLRQKTVPLQRAAKGRSGGLPPPLF